MRGRIVTALRRDPLTAFLLLGSIAIAVAFALLLGSTMPERRGGRTGISEVLRLTDAKQVRSATILDYDHRIVLRLRDGRELWAQLPSGGGQAVDVAGRLSRNGALVDVDGQAGKEVRRSVVQYLLPILLLVCLFSLFMRLGNVGGGGSIIATFSRWRGRSRRPGAAVTFAQVAAVGEAVAELREICDYLADPQRYVRIGAHAPRGVLLVGPPGTALHKVSIVSRGRRVGTAAQMLVDHDRTVLRESDLLRLLLVTMAGAARRRRAAA